MVLDSSAIIAIELQEPGFERLIDRIGEAKAVIIGVPTMFETVMVLSRRRGQDARPWLRGFLRSARAEAVTFTEEHLDAAIDAFLRFGLAKSLLEEAGIIFFTMDRNPAARQESGNWQVGGVAMRYCA